MLGKQWLNRYVSTDLRGSAMERSQNRQRKLDGIVVWYFDHVMESLPLMLQAALLLLGCALSRYLWDIGITVALVVLVVTSFGLAFYLFVIIAGVVFESCPYQTPGSHILRHLGPKVQTIIYSLHSAITSLLWNASKRSQVARIVVMNTHLDDPLQPGSETIRCLSGLVLGIPRGFAIDVYHLGRAAIRLVFALPIGTYRLVRSAITKLHAMYSAFKQKSGQRMTSSHLRCVSWMLQTSLDKPVHLTTLRHLLTVTEFAGLDPTLVVDCFNVFVGCVSSSNHKVVVIQGLEQLATVSATCFLRTFHHILVVDPTSSVLADLRRRFNAVFPSDLGSTDLPFDSTMVMIHVLVSPVGNHRNVQWDNYSSSSQEYIPFAQYMAEAAREGYQQTQYRKVPRWILRFALRSLSLDPSPPTSILADCLSIVATDLDCDVSNITTLDQRCVQI
jgi:hypothetical protein